MVYVEKPDGHTFSLDELSSTAATLDVDGVDTSVRPNVAEVTVAAGADVTDVARQLAKSFPGVPVKWSGVVTSSS
jgi:hypothetical protein